jgi:hypothetical protein
VLGERWITMRLWSIHPKYLDVKGLTGLWRESLLAQKVLLNHTRGWKNHPQLYRFKEHESPIAAIGFYLLEIYLEAERRGYSFDKSKIIKPTEKVKKIKISESQLRYEFNILKERLKKRDPNKYFELPNFKEHGRSPEPHLLFFLIEGDVEPWERSYWRTQVHTV